MRGAAMATRCLAAVLGVGGGGVDGVFRQWVADTYKLMYCTRAD